MTSVIWFRRDLRIRDLPALNAAAANGPVVALFVVDPVLSPARTSSRRWDLLERALRGLDLSLQGLGGRLLRISGHPEDVIPTTAAEFGAGSVHASSDYSPHGRRRDQRVARRLSEAGVQFVTHPGLLNAEPDAVRLSDERPVRTFAAFRRRWPCPVPPLLDAPANLAFRNAAGFSPPPAGGGPPWTADEAGQQLDAWVEGGLNSYARDRDRLDLAGTSKLSAALHFGILSPREVYLRCEGDDEHRRKFADELAWRDFAAYLLWHHPESTKEPLQSRYRAFQWQHDPVGFSVWRAGETGYPVVDAAMRELAATGWMHNRARMVVASFLTKHLLIDWRLGQAHFMDHLIDGDVANNMAGWQWASSMGIDSQPYFRIFNPARQGERFDPHGSYTRRWIPELAGVPDRYLQSPWTMPAGVAAGCGVVIGRDYPRPIVDHAEARVRALDWFGRAARG